MDAAEVPTAMVEAAARARYNSTASTSGAEDWWAQARDDMKRVYRTDAAFVLAAALSVCEARREHRVTNRLGGPSQAIHIYSWRSVDWALPEPYGDSLVERRWVFTTPAEPVPDDGGET